MTFGVVVPCGSVSTNGTPWNVLGDQSGRTKRSTAASLLLNMPSVLTAVAALPSGKGKNLPRCVRNSSKFVKSLGVSCFSNPSGISDFGEAVNSSMSSRSNTCFLAWASISSMAVFDSEASRPVKTWPWLVDTV